MGCKIAQQNRTVKSHNEIARVNASLEIVKENEINYFFVALLFFFGETNRCSYIGAMTFIRMTHNLMTLSVMTFIRKTFNMTLSMLTFIKITLNKAALSKMSFIKMTLNIKKLIIKKMTFSTTACHHSA